MRLRDSENGNCYFHWNFCLCERNALAGDSKTSGLLQSRFKGVLGHELWTGAGNPRENRICMEIAMRFHVSNSYVFRGLGGQSNMMGAYPQSSWENKDWICIVFLCKWRYGIRPWVFKHFAFLFFGHRAGWLQGQCVTRVFDETSGGPLLWQIASENWFVCDGSRL